VGVQQHGWPSRLFGYWSPEQRARMHALGLLQKNAAHSEPAAVLIVMHACVAGKTHRELFSEFYEDLLRAPLAAALAANPAPPASLALFQRMMHDILSGGQAADPVEQVGWRVSLLLSAD
jgi:hypothetical protein